MTNITAEYDAGQGRIEAINHDEDYRKLQSAFWILERLGDLKDEGRAATLDTLLTASVRRDSTATPDVIVPIVKWMTAVGLLAKRATA